MMGGCSEKDDAGDGWVMCSDCSLDAWIGSFTGKATFYNATLVTEEEDLDITVEFTETATEYLTVYITVPNYYSAAVSGDWTSPYSVSFAGSSTSLDGTMFKRYDRDSALRFSGNSKKFQFKGDSLVVEKVVTFEVFK